LTAYVAGPATAEPECLHLLKLCPHRQRDKQTDTHKHRRNWSPYLRTAQLQPAWIDCTKFGELASSVISHVANRSRQSVLSCTFGSPGVATCGSSVRRGGAVIKRSRVGTATRPACRFSLICSQNRQRSACYSASDSLRRALASRKTSTAVNTANHIRGPTFSRC